VEYKAPWYGSRIVFVDPALTSQCCSACGTVDAASRISRSRFVCTGCGNIFDADVNAARNMLRIASAQLEDFRGWPVDRAGLPAGSRNETLARAEARPFRAESSHTDITPSPRSLSMATGPMLKN
jgi:hypothetical protein